MDGHQVGRELLTGAEAVTAMLGAHGVRLVFAYPGTSELALCTTLAAQPDMRLINARGDAEAAFMAAGANLLQPGSAVSILHGARGLTAALGAICDTRRSEISALHIAGMASRTSSRYLPPHAEPDLISNAGVFATAAFDASTFTGWDAAEFVDIVCLALVALDTLPAGPVLLGIPQDILDQPFIPPALVRRCRPAPSPADASGDVAQAATLLASSQHTLVLVDDYLLRHGLGAETALGALAETIGAPVLQVAYRRGPMLFGHLHRNRVPTLVGPYHSDNEDHQALMASADLLVTIEDRNMYPRVMGNLPICRKIAITSNPIAARKNCYLGPDDLLLAGNPATILQHLTMALPRGGSGDRNREHPPSDMPKNRMPGRRGDHWGHSVLGTSTPAPPAERCPSATALATAIITALGHVPNPVLIDDSQMLGGLLAQHHHLFPETLRIFGSHGGYVGSGLATAVGAALATLDATIVCTVGDHGYTNGIKALATAGEAPAPVLIIVCNNGGSISLETEACSIRISKGDIRWMINSQITSYTTLAAAYGIDNTAIIWPDCRDKSLAVDAAAKELIKATTASGTGRPSLTEVNTPNDPDFWVNIWHTKETKLH